MQKKRDKFLENENSTNLFKKPSCSRELVDQLRSAPSISELDKAEKTVAAVVLSEEFGLVMLNTTKPSKQGIDLCMFHPEEGPATVEVKVTRTPKQSNIPFPKHLKQGYGHRQGTIGWLRGVLEHNALGEETAADLILRQNLEHPEKIPMLGVHIKLDRMLVDVYFRMPTADPDFPRWVVLRENLPLEKFITEK